MADEFVLSTTPPGEQEIDQRRMFQQQLGIDSLFLLTSPGPCRGGGRGRRAAAALARARRATPASPRCSRWPGTPISPSARTSAPACRSAGWKATPSSSAARRPPSRPSRGRVARFDAALAHPGHRRGRGRSPTSPRSARRAGAARPADCTAEAAGGGGRGARRSSSTSRSTPKPTPVPERHLRLRTASSGRSSDLEGDNGLPYRTAEDPGFPSWTRRTRAWTAPRPSSPSISTGMPAPPSVVADGIEARLIEAEAQLQIRRLRRA